MTIYLERFINAQVHEYAKALKEIKNGKKESHWMWYIFPQVTGLGKSITSKQYGIKNIDEAAAYLHHPLLGKRLIEISTELLQLLQDDAFKIFGSPDHLKLKSSMTLFSQVPGAPLIFKEVIDKFFDGALDIQTLEILDHPKSSN